MAEADEIKKVKKQLEDLKKSLDDISKQSLESILKTFSSGKYSLSEWNTQLDLFQLKADSLSDDLDYISKSFVDSVNSLKIQNEYINRQVGASRKLTSIADQLLSMRKGDSTYDLKKIKKLEEQAKMQKRILQSQIDQTVEGSKERASLNDKIKTTNILLENFTEITQEAKKFQKSMGITGGILKGMSKIPIIGDMLGTQEALEAAQEAAKEGASRLGTMGAAAKSMGKSLTNSLTDPLVLIGALVKGFKSFLDLGFRADTEVTNLSKSMALSKDEALEVYNNFKQISREAYLTGDATDKLFITTTNLVGAQLELADAFGTTLGFSEQQLKDQILLTKQIGFQGEEAAGIQQLAMSNGMTVKQVTGSVIKQTSALAKQTGIQLNNKKVIGEVAKISGQLRLQYANNPSLIAKAVIQTQKLGISLEQAKKQAEGLLNFEESIENELSAELLTGKNLNLEKARLLALNGDSAAAAAEMAKQVGSAAEFTNMNVIQQESLAKAVGMNADELANSLITQENLNKLGSETKSQIEAQAEALREKGDIEGANQLMNSIGDEAQAQAALERVDEQTRFNEGIEQLKSLLADVLSGPAMGLAKWLANLVSNTFALKAMFTGVALIIGGIKLTGLITQLVSALAVSGALAATSAATASAITLGVGAIAITAGIIAIMAALSSAKSQTKVNDGVFPAIGGSGHGKRTLVGPEGAIQLNNKDTVIAGTNLFDKGDDVMSGPKGSLQIASNNSSNSSDMKDLKNAMMAMANRPVNVGIDGEKVLKATTGKYSNTYGDEVGKNSYKIQ
jgi:hypothetical protein